MAVTCALTNGQTLGCRTVAGVNPAGIFLGAWACPQGPSSSIIFTATASGLITDISGATVSFFQFCQENGVGSFLSVPDASNILANGTIYYKDTVEFTIFDFNQDLINKINTILNGRWRVIIKSNSGRYFLMGQYNPVSVSAANGGIGKALGDLNGMTITMDVDEQLGPQEMTEAAALKVLTWAV